MHDFGGDSVLRRERVVRLVHHALLPAVGQALFLQVGIQQPRLKRQDALPLGAGDERAAQRHAHVHAVVELVEGDLPERRRHLIGGCECVVRQGVVELVIVRLPVGAAAERHAVEVRDARALPGFDVVIQPLFVQLHHALLQREEHARRQVHDVLARIHRRAQVAVEKRKVRVRIHLHMVHAGDVRVADPVDVPVRVAPGLRNDGGILGHGEGERLRLSGVGDGQLPFLLRVFAHVFNEGLERRRRGHARGHERVVNRLQHLVDVERRLAEDGFVYVVVQIGAALLRAGVHLHRNRQKLAQAKRRVRSLHLDRHGDARR